MGVHGHGPSRANRDQWFLKKPPAVLVAEKWRLSEISFSCRWTTPVGFLTATPVRKFFFEDSKCLGNLSPRRRTRICSPAAEMPNRLLPSADPPIYFQKLSGDEMVTKPLSSCPVSGPTADIFKRRANEECAQPAPSAGGKSAKRTTGGGNLFQPGKQTRLGTWPSGVMSA